MMTQRQNIAVTALLALLFTGVFAALAMAVDGTKLIDHAKALAGGVTPGDAPGYPVTISQPGSYRLSSNLTVPNANTTAIEISADDVTVDLNGFAILGPTICTSFPVSSCAPTGTGFGITTGVAPDRRNIAVHNGTVRGMGNSGIILDGGGAYGGQGARGQQWQRRNPRFWHREPQYRNRQWQ